MSKAKAKKDFSAIPGFEAFSDINKFGIQTLDDDDINDDDLEAELAQLSSNKPKAAAKPKPKKPSAADLQKELQNINIDKLLSDNIEDDDMGDIDDEDLEAELNELGPEDDDMEEEIVKEEPKKVAPAPPRPIAAPTTNTDNKTLAMLEENIKSFQKKLAESSSDPAKQRRLKRNIEQYDNAIKACKAGKSFDYASLPGFEMNNAMKMVNDSKSIKIDDEAVIAEEKKVEPPPIPPRSAPEPKPTPPAIPKREAPVPPPQQPVVENNTTNAELPEASEEEVRKIFKAPPPAKTTLEALEQLEVEFKRKINEANEANDSSKKRRFERNYKMVESAIKATKLKKPFNYEEVANITPPGFTRVPVESGGGIPAAKPQASAVSAGSSPANSIQKAPAATPPKAQNPKMAAHNKDLAILLERQKLFKEAAVNAKKNGNEKLAVHYLKQSKGFETMITAAQNGLPLDMSKIPTPPQLEEKMRKEKEMKKNSSSQLNPVKSDGDWEIVNNDEDMFHGSRDEIYNSLEAYLRNQLKIAAANSQNFTNNGDAANAAKFNLIEKESLKDLKQLLDAKKNGSPVPKYHFETRKYDMFNCCLDLTDNDLELKIIRGLNYQTPAGFDNNSFQTYVKFDFPYPEKTQGDKTPKQNGDCPEYASSFKLTIDRKHNQFLRVVNRKEIKIEIYQKMGLFRSDKLLASSNVKLQPLEDKCVVHDTYNLFEGRKQVNGKIEIEMRIREPILRKEIKLLEEKWLIIDKIVPNVNVGRVANIDNAKPDSITTLSKLVLNLHIDSNNAAEETQPAAETSASITAEDVHSIEVLNFERNLLEKQIETYSKRLNTTQLMELMEKSEYLNQLIITLREKLKTGGIEEFKIYLNKIASLPRRYEEMAIQCERSGDMNKATLQRKKKAIVEAEITKIRERLNQK